MANKTEAEKAAEKEAQKAALAAATKKEEPNTTPAPKPPAAPKDSETKTAPEPEPEAEPEEFSYPEYTGVIALVRKKQEGTYEPLGGKVISHKNPTKLMSEADVEKYSGNGFLEVRYTNDYERYKSDRQAAELAFLKKRK